MAVRAVLKVCRRRGAGQAVFMTGCAVVGAGRGDQGAVISTCRRMERAPGRTVTRGAIATGSEVLTYRRILQAAVATMAVRAVLKVRVRSSADQGVVVAACTIGDFL